MAFAIPKIEYKNGETSGAIQSGSGIITAIVDQANMEVGMFIKGTGIPDGAKVGIVLEDGIQLADGVLATATNSGATLSYGFAIEFDFPPKETKGEALETKATISESLSGLRQVSVNSIEGVRSLMFSFLSPSVYTLVDTFLRTHALLGFDFRYFEDKTLLTYVDYELDTFKIDPRKIAPKGVDVYTWEVPLKFRRVI